MNIRGATGFGRIARMSLAMIIVLLLGAAAARSGLHLMFRVIGYELGGPYTADSPLYWAVGRGILNGLIPYRDLFETKPPGIFLLSSLSLWIFDDMRLGAVMQAISLLAIPLAIGTAAWIITQKCRGFGRWMIICGALLFGTVIARYTAERSGEFQVESFGATFGVVYAALLVTTRGHLRARETLIAVLCILASVGLKEPFLLTCLASALLLCNGARGFFRGFLLPAILAGTVGIILLALLGYLGPYIHIYLTEMLGRHIFGAGPLWERGYRFHLLFRDLHAFSPALAWGIPALAIGFLSFGFGRGRMLKGMGRVALVLMAAYLTTLAVGVGGAYYNHHFVFAVGGYAALFFAFLAAAVHRWEQGLPTRAVAVAVLALLIPTISGYPPVDYKAQLAFFSEDSQNQRSLAAKVDTILDQCDVDRYLFLGGNGSQPYGFTRHSPLGPLFFQYGYLLNGDRPEFRQAFTQSLHQARFVVFQYLDLDTLTEETTKYLDEEFTKDSWPCAWGVELPSSYTFLYRKQNVAASVTEPVRVVEDEARFLRIQQSIIFPSP